MIWTPYQKGHLYLLESVQRRLMRYMSFKLNIPMHYTDHDYSELSILLNVPKIKTRHDVNDCVFVWKIINDKIRCTDLKLLFKERKIDWDIRNFRLLKEQRVTDKLYIYFSTKYRLIRAWNSLDDDIRKIKNENQFKRLVTEKLLDFY